MNRAGLSLPADAPVLALARRLAESGGRLLIVGGWVRDRLRGEDSKDFDLEVFGLSAEAVSALVRPLGFTPPVGKHFPIWRHTGNALDLALPRLEAVDSENEAEVPGVSEEPGEEVFTAAFRAAARHRDLTINAMGWDPLAERLIDPWEGESDLAKGRLRAVSEDTFPADPLRLLRVARLTAQSGYAPDDALRRLCRALDLSKVPVERIAGELARILCEPVEPSRAFEWLAECDRLDVFPLVDALRDCPQDPRWHPEGDVFVHTLMVIDEARKLAAPLSHADRLILMLAALTHDLGKPGTTEIEGDRVRAHGHEALSAKLTQAWLRELRFSEGVVSGTTALVAYHLAPAQFASQGAGARAYRRLARKLDRAGVTMLDLERLGRADSLGRTTPDARAGTFASGDAFLEAAEAAHVREGIEADCVTAQHLIGRGMIPGPKFGEILRACRAIQDETGDREPERILDRALAPDPSAPNGLD
ncbi:MAG: HDIG domain-containing metalloprotein [Myxococcota bacterium]